MATPKATPVTTTARASALDVAGTAESAGTGVAAGQRAKTMPQGSAYAPKARERDQDQKCGERMRQARLCRRNIASPVGTGIASVGGGKIEEAAPMRICAVSAFPDHRMHRVRRTQGPAVFIHDQRGPAPSARVIRSSREWPIRIRCQWHDIGVSDLVLDVGGRDGRPHRRRNDERYETNEPDHQQDGGIRQNEMTSPLHGRHPRRVTRHHSSTSSWRYRRWAGSWSRSIRFDTR